MSGLTQNHCQIIGDGNILAVIIGDSAWVMSGAWINGFQTSMRNHARMIDITDLSSAGRGTRDVVPGVIETIMNIEVCVRGEVKKNT